MPSFSKLSRTDISALISVALFGMTILVTAVGPAEAQGSSELASDSITPAVSAVNFGYPA